MSNPSMPESDATSQPIPKPREISGTKVVIGMFLLGLFLTLLLFIYFELHTRPFRPLREAIGREFKHSRPNVEGGRVKGRGQQTLRISLSVPFDPFTDEKQAAERNERILQLAREYQDLPSYEKVQINLIQFVPQSEAKRRTFEWSGVDAAKTNASQ
jgi:hypothetical protein